MEFQAPKRESAASLHPLPAEPVINSGAVAELVCSPTRSLPRGQEKRLQSGTCLGTRPCEVVEQVLGRSN